MEADDELCLCFHVTRRKVEQFIRAQRPVVASQLSECYGAGTGCGWCRPFLERLHTQITAAEETAHERAAGGLVASADALPEAADYAVARAAYRRKLRASGGGE